MLIQKYNPQWKENFKALSKIYAIQLEGIPFRIEHVGSTSVVGLAAKAIIDIDVVYTEAEDFDFIKLKFELLGYFHNGDQGIPLREVFKRKPGEHRKVLDEIAHHLYVCPQHSPELERHLLFRDHLRSSPDACRAYEQKKKAIAEKVLHNKKEYATLKQIEVNPFIDQMIALEKEKRKNSNN